MLLKISTLFVAGALFAGAWLVPWPQTTNSATPVTDSNPVELGAVHWSRDLDTGTAEAKRTGKPLLVLFQEVPGCSNCTRYGSVTLSHPLIVEAIEEFFVPVCIYNNKDGADAAALRKFNEPAWNNPVVRIIRSDHRDIIPRISDFRSSATLVQGMLRSIQAEGREAPAWLRLVAEELQTREAGVTTATFSMYCFWSGEKAFGAIPGVIETEPGFQDGREVVRVTYNPDIIQASELERLTRPKGISACSRESGFRADREPKYYLAQTHWKYVPMTSLQACRANALAGNGQSPEAVLSERQQELGQYVQAHPKQKWENAIGTTDLAKAWAAAGKKQASGK
ncbi:MAG: thioredoxin family protein [Bacteroidetes bacterium]|nr:MAG: thioredoxin family protein [Bacteroidota bacterium]